MCKGIQLLQWQMTRLMYSQPVPQSELWQFRCTLAPGVSTYRLIGWYCQDDRDHCMTGRLWLPFGCCRSNRLKADHMKSALTTQERETSHHFLHVAWTRWTAAPRHRQSTPLKVPSVQFLFYPFFDDRQLATSKSKCFVFFIDRDVSNLLSSPWE